MSKRRIWISTSDFDQEKYPIPPARVVPSDTECVHTPTPEGYTQWHEWAHQASKTHGQIRCPRCGLWAIWLPKKEARAINRAAEKAQKQFVKAYQRAFDAARAEGRPCTFEK